MSADEQARQDDLEGGQDDSTSVELANPDAVAKVEPIRPVAGDVHLVWLARMCKRSFQDLGDRLSAIEAQRTARWADAWKSLAIITTTAWLLLMGVVGIPAMRVELAMLLLDERHEHALGLVTEILERREAVDRAEVDHGAE